MLLDLLKDLGAGRVLTATTATTGLDLAKTVDPQIIITEFAASHFDGLDFVRCVRRSELDCRKAPVVMITAEATAQAIIGARDAGVHEFLRRRRGCLVAGMVLDVGRPVLVAGDGAGPDGPAAFSHWPASCSGCCCDG